MSPLPRESSGYRRESGSDAGSGPLVRSFKGNAAMLEIRASLFDFLLPRGDLRGCRRSSPDENPVEQGDGNRSEQNQRLAEANAGYEDEADRDPEWR